MNTRFFAGFVISTFVFLGCAQKYESTEKFKNDSPVFLVIGHRGAAAYAPENTIASFDKALSLGVRDIELDVQLTKDNQLVVYHDDDLSKKTKGKGPVHGITLKEFKKLEIGTWFDKERPQTEIFTGTKLATLAEVLDKYKDKFFYHIEIKGHEKEIPKLVLDMLKKKKLYSNALITSFDKDQLLRVRELDKAIALCYLIEDDDKELIRIAIRDSRSWGFQQVAVDAKALLLAHVLEANRAGLYIRGYGIKSREDFDHVVEMGASGTTSDWPDWKPAPPPKKKR